MEECRSGRTTRLIDEYIQRFFNEPIYTPIIVVDHDVDGKPATYESNVELLKKIENRLTKEHGNSTWYSTKHANFFKLRAFNNDNYCVIIRTNDPVSDMRRKELEYYKEQQYNDYINSPSILDVFHIGRATGATTRLADKYIQEFFSKKTGEYIEVFDHYCGGLANVMLCNIICRRLENEHKAKFQVKNGYAPKIIKVE